MAKVLGTKITNNKEIENQIILWIQNEPKISDYKISKQLDEKFNIKISQPTIKRWKLNFYKDTEKKLEEEKNDLIGANQNLDIKEIDIKYEHLKNIIQQLDDLKERKDIIKKNLQDNVKEKDGVKTPIIDTFKESIYQKYIDLIISLEDKILKYTSGTNPYLMLRELTETIIKFILVIFKKYDITEEDTNKLKDFLKELDGENYIKYNIERKISK